MSDLLNILTQSIPRIHNTTAKPSVPTDSNFRLDDLSKVIKTNTRTEQQNKDNTETNSGFLPQNVLMPCVKDPLYTAKALKTALSPEMLSELTSKDKELADTVSNFIKEFMLSSENITDDILNQQNGQSLFSGKLFDILREILNNTNNPEIKNAVVNFLKAYSSSLSKNDIISSVSANLKYLSIKLMPSKTLSENLLSLSKEFAGHNAGDNFSELKAKALSILTEVDNSLLLNDKLKAIIPLVTYNLSRLTSADTPSDAFAKLLFAFPQNDIKNALKESYDELFNDGVSENIKNILSSQEAVNNSDLSEALSKINTADGEKSLKSILTLGFPHSKSSDVESLINSFNENKDLNILLNHLSELLNGIDNTETKILLANMLNKSLSVLAAKQGVKYSPPTSADKLCEFLSENISKPAFNSSINQQDNAILSALLSTPSAMTPLSHYLCPLKSGDTNAYGELWCSSNKNSNDLLLSFEVEGIGEFELFLETADMNINVRLSCPPSLTAAFQGIKPVINKIAMQEGYKVKANEIVSLDKKHELTDIFPEINERRTSINVTI